MSYYLIKDDGRERHYTPVTVLDQPNLNVLNHDIRQQILHELAKQPMFAAELARKLNIHEQTIYYHLKQLITTGVIHQVSEEQIRGTIAKKYAPDSLNFAYIMDDEWHNISELHSETDTNLRRFLNPFLDENTLNADIVVGSPDPHGPYKSYARDGHYATDLALFLGGFCTMPDDFTVKIDVDVKAEKTHDNNMIIVGGPGTNILTQELNQFLPVKFDMHEANEGFACSGIIGKNQKSTGEHMGIICRTTNPYNPDNWILVLAGYRCIGSKTAVLGLTRYHDDVLKKFDDQTSFGAIVDGYDLNGDGKLDSVELVE
jgi:DNA-binding transcriptional ArsR family regulator